MSKFKVGDTVKVVGTNGIANIFPIGTVGKVVEAELPILLVESLHPIFCNEKTIQYVSDCDLELISNSKARSNKSIWKVVISSTGDETTARFYEDGKCPMTATVRRYYKDKYDALIASTEAVKKLFGKQEKPTEQTEPEKPKGFTGKAMYISDYKYQSFTKGRIYEFVDGNVTDDSGAKRPNPLNGVWSAQKEHWFRKYFIIVVE